MSDAIENKVEKIMKLIRMLSSALCYEEPNPPFVILTDEDLLHVRFEPFEKKVREILSK